MLLIGNVVCSRRNLGRVAEDIRVQILVVVNFEDGVAHATLAALAVDGKRTDDQTVGQEQFLVERGYGESMLGQGRGSVSEWNVTWSYRTSAAVASGQNRIRLSAP